ncbi:MAG: hypothetical protein JOY82_20870 [Streptosporangiaceae bacterium]|nr:hypothetical protein [Streptosporangiaceae bacterium]MBV9856937.1 hypothetical protein [Streptosporangiaceae bacterium]
MYEGPTSTKFGQISVAEPLRFDLLEVYNGTSPLQEVDHQVPIPVLDQEDLHAQGIDVTKLVPGAQDTDALGSCTCNSGTGHIAERWAAAGKSLADLKLNGANGTLGLSGAAAADEEFAIVLYHLVTDQTGLPAQEWPPTDCGSTGLYVCQELITQGLAASYRTASNVTGALSLLQTGTVMQGGPWFHSWMTPDSNGFVDGDGSYEAFQAATNSGVAGGHETLQVGIPQLAQAANGTIDLASTVIKVRNSWSTKWGENGEFFLHASTLNYLGRHYDFKAAVI